MKKTPALKVITTFFKKNSPQILIGVGLSGFVSTVALAIHATPKAEKLIEKKKEELQKDKLTPIEMLQTTWKVYTPMFASGVFSIGCILMANHQYLRRNAALATAFTLSDAAYKEYKSATEETVSEKEVEEIATKIAKKHMEEKEYEPVEIATNRSGASKCYDAISGREFDCDIETLRQIENRLNRRLLDDMYISVNDFYDELGLAHIKPGDDLGWNIRDGLIDFHYDSILNDKGEPCLLLDYHMSPDPNFMMR